jgi:RHS repeat-associated protein
VLDASQNVVASYSYDEFGVQTGNYTLDQPYRFSTKRYYDGVGLSYYGYRFYSASLGRWLTRDPIGIAGGLNLYGFVGNGPMNGVDAWGLQPGVPPTAMPTIDDQGNYDMRPPPRIELRSWWLFRLLVPGQIAWDNARTAYANGDYAGAGVNTAAMLGEMTMAVYSLGESYGAKTSINCATSETEILTTKHGAERIGANATRGGALNEAEYFATKSGATRVMLQRDGAMVYIQEISPGKFNVVVENPETGELITTVKHTTQRKLDNLARNYGWY